MTRKATSLTKKTRQKSATKPGRKTSHVSSRLKRVRQTKFLAAFSGCGNVTEAARIAEMATRTHYDWLETDSTYPERFKDAEKEAADFLEEKAWGRATEGVSEPVGWYRGIAGGEVQKYSDTLLIFLLKGLRPEKYRERYEHTGKLETGPAVKIYIPDNRRDSGNGPS